MSSLTTIVRTQDILRRLQAIEEQAKALLIEAAGLRDLLSADVSTPASYKAPALRAVAKRNQRIYRQHFKAITSPK